MSTRIERLERLAVLTRAMRDAQRRYFSRRDREDLIDAKEREVDVDSALVWLDQTEEPRRDDDIPF
jgi:hypothetical protein